MPLLTPLSLYVGVVAVLLVLAAVLHMLKRLGPGGARLRDIACRAPVLDLTVFVFTVAGPIVGVVWGAWQGDSLTRCLLLMLVGVLGHISALWVWIVLHEIRHYSRASRSPRIRATLSKLVGPVRNHVAVWWTAWAVPVFALIRIAEYLVYPPLVWLVKFPRYDHGKWVNVSRVKFDGLVGYDLIWCLYCDWMTGVWSLGGEMLRNVESFWCPIRFASPEKCENCRHDFPDVLNGWVKPGGTMAEVTSLLEEKYPASNPAGGNTWFGHPARLTVEGREVGGR
ncbi:MAG: hypothetical protein ACKVZJ_14920 [Phycisphaerales bacterium]